MSDRPQVGVRVWRSDVTGLWRDDDPPAFDGYHVPYFAISLDAASLVGLRIAADVEIGSVALKTGYGYVPVDEVRDAVFRALGLEAVVDP